MSLGAPAGIELLRAEPAQQLVATLAVAAR